MKNLMILVLCSFLTIGYLGHSVHASEQEKNTLTGQVKEIDGQYGYVELNSGETVMTYSKVPFSNDMLGKKVTLSVEQIGDTYEVKEVKEVKSISSVR